MDETGRIIDGDLILYIYAAYMHRRGKLEDTKVVTTVMSNIGLYKALDRLGIGYEKTLWVINTSTSACLKAGICWAANSQDILSSGNLPTRATECSPPSS